MPNAVNILPVTPPPPRTSPAASPGDGGASKFHDALDQARQKDSSRARKSTAPRPTSDSSPAGKPGKGVKAAKAPSKSQSQEVDESDSAEPAKPAANPASPGAAALAGGATAESEVAAENPKPKAAAHTPHSADETQDAQLAAGQQPADIVTAVSKDPNGSSRQPKEQPGKGSASVDAIEADDSADAPQDSGQAIPGSLKLGGALAREIDSGVSPAVNSSASTDDNDAAIAAAVAASDDDSDTAPATPDKGVSAGPAAAIDGPHTALHAFSEALATAQGQVSASGNNDPPAATVAVKPTPVPPEVQFSQDNQAHIVSSVHTQLLPNGGSMQIRLDPPDLGAMSVSVHMRNGIMTATFDTSTDQAARLLTHNLGQLKTALESQGVSVGSLHVQQTPRDSQSNSQHSGKESDGGPNDQTAQQQQRDQQRREMLRQMWRRLNGGNDPLDLVA